MTFLSDTRSNVRNIKFDSALGIFLAVLGGVFISILPSEYSFAGAVVLALVVLVIMTPLAAIALLLVLSPMRALILTEAPEFMPLDIGLFFTALAVGAWFVHRIVVLRRPFVSVRSGLVVRLLVFIIVNVISGFVAGSTMAWAVETFKWLVIGLLAYVIYSLVNMSFQWQWLIASLCAAGMANALVGLYIFFGGSGALHLLINDRYFRSFGTFGQPNPFGGFMGLLAPLAIMMVYGYGSLVVRQWLWFKKIETSVLRWLVFYSAGAALLTIGVFISWSRGAWLGFSLSLVVMFLAIPRLWWQRIAVLLLIIVVSFLIWTSNLLPATITERVGSATLELFQLNDVRAVDITSDNYPIVERLAHWQAALNMAEHNFWIGVGAGNYEVAYADYRLINWEEPLGHAHNFYLNVLAETGIIGLFAFLLLMMSLWCVSWRACGHPDVIARAAAIGFVGTWTYLLAHSLTDNLFVNNLFLHIGVMVGVVIILDQSMRPVKVLSA